MEVSAVRKVLRETSREQADRLPSARSVPPRRVALVDAGPSGGCPAVEALLDDFEDAYRAYARRGGVDERANLELRRFARERDGGRSDGEPMAVDAVVLACPLECADPFEWLPDRLTAPRGSENDRGNGAPRFYALCCTDEFDAEHALPLLEALERPCEASGFAWSGGLIVSAGGVIPRIAGGPRMGFLRRNVSEAIDQLILAVRCSADAGVLVARPPLPRFAYRLYRNRTR